MYIFEQRLPTGTVVPAFVLGASLSVAAISFAPAEAAAASQAAAPKALPMAKARPTGVQLAACNPCAGKNPCAANPCNPCAAKRAACNPCNPCAPKNPCAANPCNPCAANPCSPCSPCGPNRAVEVNPCKAATLYAELKGKMIKGYAGSGLDVATNYLGWTNVAKVPYPSATHGGRYVNNYVNAAGAHRYTKFEQAGAMPPGTIVAKDSFTVGADGKAKPGPLFLMEKVPGGLLASTNGWKYTLIMPNGTMVGMTGATGSAKVQFCHDCHIGVAESQDHMFFLPDEMRRK